MRTGPPRSYTTAQLTLMQASLRMHRNPVLYNMPTAVRQPVLAQPIPSNWTTESTLRARRRQGARVHREDSYIIPAENEPNHASVNSKEPEALPVPDNDAQEPLPTTAKRQPSSPPPVAVRQRQTTHRRRAPANVDSNNLLVNDADSSSANENEKPAIIDLLTPVPTNIIRKETGVDSVLNSATAPLHGGPTTPRPSMIFQKVDRDVAEPIVKSHRRVTERRLPLQESSV